MTTIRWWWWWNHNQLIQSLLHYNNLLGFYWRRLFRRLPRFPAPSHPTLIPAAPPLLDTPRRLSPLPHVVGCYTFPFLASFFYFPPDVRLYGHLHSFDGPPHFRMLSQFQSENARVLGPEAFSRSRFRVFLKIKKIRVKRLWMCCRRRRGNRFCWFFQVGFGQWRFGLI